MRNSFVLVGVAAAIAFAAPAGADGSGGVAGCADSEGRTPGELASIRSPFVTQDSGPPPGPMAGPHSRHDWSGGGGKNNGTDLVVFCDLIP